MTRARPAQVSPDNCTAGNNGLATKDDVLRSGDGRTTRDFVARVLHICGSFHDVDIRAQSDDLTVSMYSARE